MAVVCFDLGSVVEPGILAPEIVGTFRETSALACTHTRQNHIEKDSTPLAVQELVAFELDLQRLAVLKTRIVVERDLVAAERFLLVFPAKTPAPPHQFRPSFLHQPCFALIVKDPLRPRSQRLADH